ncbi:transcription regulator protein BACH1-like [Kryptolebias marmoratus]|uniref:Transcription regulator protein BACH1-like n=1 Tax=Kryptolebias marmoratus TaxID=37003 RepID=A0A3Q2ZM80_KRYMA|nr:transcription regulator protein BACH1-like [Kryptolebias marmoratus]
MSQMSAPRSSVFTFESTVHSSHVLQWLNEQRCRDLLCDVTVVVEAQSFRAHRSVLASCSEYFAQKISSLTQHGAVINLPEEVTVVGFEPLLKFAYTSKLHFGKEDVLEIQNSASILGFRDLDEACFDFLLPKLLACNKDPAPFVRKTCCKKTWKRQLSVENGGTDSDKVLLDDKEVKPVADSSSQQDVTWDCGKSGSKKTGSLNNAKPLGTAVEDIDGIIQQCPKYRKFQQACKKELVAEKSPTDVRKPVIEDGCFLSCSPCPSSAQCKIKTAVLGNSASNKKIKGNAKEPHETEEHKVKSENSGATQGVDIVKKNTLEREENFHENALENNMERLKEQMMEHSSSSDTLCVKIVSSESNPRLDESPLEVLQPRCFVRDLSEGQSICRSPSHEKTVNITENPEARNPSVADSGAIQTVPVEAEGTRPRSVCQDGGNGRQTDNMQRAAIFVENSRERSNSQPNFQDPEVRYSPDAVGRWSPSLLQDNLCPTKNNCPCLLDLDQASCSLNPAGMSECEAASQSGVSSLNSGEDGDSETETEGDCELYTRERAMQVQLPYPVDWIVNLSRNDFQHLLKQQPFTREQLDFVHDMRRRSKNRLAAQRCRKRKLDCIYNLQCEINKLKTQKEKLIMEKNQLSQMKSNTCHSVSTLCQRVCSEANLQPDQLQVLTKYTFSDCPLTSFFPHIDALLSQHGFPLHPFRLPCSADLEFVASKEDPSGANGDTVTRKHAL